ncbi:hypothetical protein B484DRAFT_484110, partial [Ochromonadaceae sp. CCMP2298]
MPKRSAPPEAVSEGAKSKQARLNKVKSLEGVSAEDFELADLKGLKPIITKHVRDLAKMVNADWHDGYEEQGQEISEYMGKVATMLQAVYSISVQSQTGFERCHEIIKLIVDSWEDFKSIPMQGSVEDQFTSLQDGGNDYGGPETKIKVNNCETRVFDIKDGDEMALKMWPRFLLAAASCTSCDKILHIYTCTTLYNNDYPSSDKVTDEMLGRFIKDAADFQCAVLSAPYGEEEEEEEENKKDDEAAIRRV